MLIKKSFFYILLFFFTFNTNFTFFPYPTRVVISLVGMGVFLLRLRCENTKINKNDLKCLLWFLLLITAGIISILINKESDLSFYKEECLILMIVPFWGSCLVAYAGRNINLSLFDFLKSYVNINIVQSIIIIAGFIIPNVKQNLIDMQRWNERTEFIITYGGRMCGLGIRFDYGAAIISISLICTIFLYFIDKERKALKYIIIYIVQTIAGLLVARSIVIGILCSIIFFFLVDDNRNAKFEILKKICIIVGIIIVVGCIFKSELQPFYIKHENTFKWAFEFFYSDELAKSGSTSNSWTKIVEDMYFIPDNPKTWFVGDGRFSTVKGNPYMGVDPLYMRYLLFFGIFGLMIFWGFLKSVYNMILKSSKNFNFTSESEMRKFKKFFGVLFLFVLLVYLKSNIHCFHFIFYLLFFFKFCDKANELSAKNIRYS